MYVVIVCTNCHGSSQVDKNAIGKAVECPLCGGTTIARASEAVLPVAKPIEITTPSATQEAPLSLDDATPLPPLDSERAAFTDEPKRGAAQRSPLRTFLYALTSLLVTLLLMLTIYKAFRYGSGDIPPSAWKTLPLPDGRCAIDLPGEPIAEEVPAGGSGLLGGKRFVVKRWFERVQLSFGWIDLDADQWLAFRFDQAIIPVRDAEVKRFDGTLTSESSINFVVGKRKLEARTYQLDTPEGKGQLQIYFDPDSSHLTFHDVESTVSQEFQVYVPLAWGMTGTWLPVEVPVKVKKREFDPHQRIRLWFAGVSGKKITPETKWLPKFFNSFVPE